LVQFNHGAYKCTEEQAKTLDYTAGGFDRWVYKEKLVRLYGNTRLNTVQSEVRELHRIITLNNPQWRERLKRIWTDGYYRILRGRCCALHEEYEVSGELRRISTPVFNEIIKERLDWI
jgi:hypothetical protein